MRARKMGTELLLMTCFSGIENKVGALFDASVRRLVYLRKT